MLSTRTFSADFYTLGQRVIHHPTMYSFFAEDMSGKFSLLAGAVSRLLALVPGIAICRLTETESIYYGMMGAMMMFQHNHLTVITTTLVHATSTDALIPAYRTQVNAEIEKIQARKLSNRQLD